MGFQVHAIKTLKANASLRGKKKSFKEISKDFKTKSENYPTFDRKAQQAAIKRDAIIFYVVILIVFIASLALVDWIL